MAKYADAADIKRWHREAQEYTQAFREKVRTRYKIIDREYPPVTDSRMVEAVAEYQTPDVRKQINLGTQFLRLNDTLFDAIEGKEGKTGTDEANNYRLWAAREYNRQNFGYWVDDRLGEGLGAFGLSVMRLLTKGFSAKSIEGDRDEWMKHNLSGVHYFDDVDLTGFSWMPDKNGYKVAFYEAEYPVMQAMDDLKRKGYGEDKEGVYVPIQDKEAQSGVKWIGEGQAVDETKTAGDRLIVTVMEYRDESKRCPVCPDKHALWCGAELIRSSGKDFKDAEEVRRYTIGRRHAGTFRLCGQRMSSRPPEYSYQGIFDDLIIEATYINWLHTMLMTIANEHSSSSRAYLKVAQAAEGLGLSAEWFEKYFSNPIPSPDANSKQTGIIPYPGEIVLWPTQLEPALQEMLNIHREMFEGAKLNPFLSGDNQEAVIKGAASSNLQALQQARVPFNGPRSAMDAFWQQAIEDEVHEILYWNHVSEKDTELRFYNQTLGTETIARGETKAGNWVYMAPSKFTTRPSLSTRTKTETLQEQAENQRMAFERYDRYFEDAVETAKALGIVDTEAWMMRMAQRIITERHYAKKAALVDSVFDSLLPALSGVHPMAVAQQQAMQAQPPGGQEPASIQGRRTPQVELPALGSTGGGAVPVGGV